MTLAATVTPIDDATSNQATPESLPLEALLRRSASDAIRGLRTAFPASIVAVQADQTVDVQPLLQVRYAGEAQASSIRPIPSVPVLMPQGTDYRISYPVQTGDTGLIIVADRSLDAWLASTGGIVDPADTRCHHLADAVFVPGLVPTSLQTSDTGSDMVLGNGLTQVRLQKDGRISINNEAQEMVQVLHDSTQLLVDTLAAITALQVLTPFGPSPLLASSQIEFTRLRTSLVAILARLDTFKLR